MATTAAQTAGNPMFGRPAWTYVETVQSPRMGPQPRLAIGTGRTGTAAAAGQQVAMPGYVSESDYHPSPFSYSPPNNETWSAKLPRSIGVGSDGRELVGTYKPHDFAVGDRWNNQLRKAYNWQVQEYPPNFRNLLQWQQAMRYRVNSLTVSARPLDSSNYFLGYQTDPIVAAGIGQSPVGYMGSM